MNALKRKNFFTNKLVIISCFYATSLHSFISKLGLLNESPLLYCILLLGVVAASSKNINPFGIIIFSSIFFLLLINCEGFWAASLVPCIGLLFVKDEKIHFENILGPILTSLYSLTVAYTTRSEYFGPDSIANPKNYISIIICYHLIFELIFNKNRISTLYAVPILICFLGIGNRSASLLLISFINKFNTFKKKIALIFAIVFFTLGYPIISDFAIQNGLYIERSFEETRPEYINTFVKNISNILCLRNQTYDLPIISSGLAYDFHNSYLTLIWRDKIAGIFKIVIWFCSFSKIALYPQLAVSLRAGADTFLLGGVFDTLTFFYISNCLLKKCSKRN